LRVTDGHKRGAEVVKEIIRATRDWGVHTLTLWGFSTENWKRPYSERKKIFELVKETIKETLDEAKKEGVRFCHIGRKDRLPVDLMEVIRKAEEETKNNKKRILNIALDYGGRDEILRAVRRIIKDKVPAESIDEDLFASYLDTANQPYPDPDLFIRTSGEQRTSGYLPWQMVYTELYFEESHLPDLTAEKLKKAILDFSRRRRRFGAKDKIVHFTFKPEVVARLELNWWRLRNVPKDQTLMDYSIKHIKEQFGLSKEIAHKAAKHLLAALREEKNGRNWSIVFSSLKEFYKLIKSELKLAFEPSIVASLEVQFRKETSSGSDIKSMIDAEEVAKQLYAEVYRISAFQAAKLAHWRVLAAVERNLAEMGMGERHWKRAEEYLQKFYSALKERIA
jgi:undecaprenyl diphosphate synthase